jgi:hypothetical protein
MHQDGTPISTLGVSIDLRTEGHAILAAQSLPTRLLSLLDACRIAATWGFAEPASAAFIERLGRSSIDHEIALLCHHDWAGSAVGRTTFSRQLSRRLTAADRAGIQISTLAMRTTDLHKNLDLLVKHRVSVVRGRLRPPTSLDPSGQPQPVRYGVWLAPVSHVLPRSLLGAGRFWRKTFRRNGRTTGYLHLGIDQETLEDRHWKDIEAALKTAAQMRDDGSLTILTLRQLSRQLDRKPERPRSRSVLRAA